METIIHQYVKKKVKGSQRTVGILVGEKDKDGIISIGWSKVAHSKGDRFDRVRGMEIAKGRLFTDSVTVPHSIKRDTLDFMKRCQRYFKDMNAFKPVHTIHPPNQSIVVLNYQLNDNKII